MDFQADPQIITDELRHQFYSQGYLVLRDIIPQDLCAEARHDIARFLHADLCDPTSWYRTFDYAPQLDGVVPLHHSPSQWKIRQLPRLYQLFSEFFRERRLVVDINRCIFRPPLNPKYPMNGHGSIHWDTDPRVPGLGSLQAVIMLSDVHYPDSGGFQCIPEIYQNIDEWLGRNARTPEFNHFAPGLNHHHTVQVQGNAGDIILWHTRLPHGTATNASSQPRFATFVTMQPPPDDSTLGPSLQEWWQTRRAPTYWRGMPGQLDPEPGEVAPLSELGFQLIGALPWDNPALGQPFPGTTQPSLQHRNHTI